MTKPRSKTRTPEAASSAKRTLLRFDERELSPNLLAAKRQAFISAVDSTPGAYVEILAADQEGVDFWMGSLSLLRFWERPTLRVERAEKETPIWDGEMSPLLEAEIKAGMYYSSQNAVYAAESFCASIFAGRYPEWPILKWLEKGLLQSLDNHRRNQAKPKNSLDHILGLSSKKGGTPAWRAALNADRNQMLLLEMARLRSLDLKLNIDEAAKMVASRLANTPDWNKTAWSIKKLGVRSLVKLYNAWPPHGDLELELKNEQTSRWSAKETREYLGKYPKHSRPPRVNILLDK